MVDQTRTPDGKPRARLLDLIPGRSGPAYAGWLTDRGSAFTGAVCRWRPWPRSGATPTPSTTNWPTRSRLSTPSMSCGSGSRRWRRPAAGSNKNNPVRLGRTLRARARGKTVLKVAE